MKRTSQEQKTSKQFDTATHMLHWSTLIETSYPDAAGFAIATALATVLWPANAHKITLLFVRLAICYSTLCYAETESSLLTTIAVNV